MYLSKLEVFGFKSFAQRINLRFDSGLTAIVGPNGCGKTNIVDAIRWALGEQKSSVLRSEKMENVIFNGTKARKPLGMSEVTITIENTKKILPSEYTEVAITRRLYRNGDSEYLLNKVPCRLKDIQNLFVDTGMGSDAYSVIELKMIEQILSENASERRKLFEEAAGISKYKQRRKQTFSKLETTSQDLARVKDIVIEVEKKVGSLERQAKKAEQAKSIRVELRGLEIDVAERTLFDLTKKKAPLQLSLNDEERKHTELTGLLAELDKEAGEKSVAVSDREKELSALQKELQYKQELVVQTEKQMLENETRRKSISELVARSEKESAFFRERISQILEEREKLNLILEEKSIERNEAKAALEKMQAEYQEQGQALRESRSLLESTRTHRQRIANEISKLKLESQTFENRIESFETQIARQAERKAFLQSQLDSRASEVNALETRLAEAKLGLASAEEELSNAIVTRQSLEKEIAQKKEQLLQVRADYNSKNARIEFLRSLLESYEGLPEGVKFLDKQVLNGNDRKYGLGTLSDLISTDEAYAMAVNAALGEAQNYYVSRSLPEALAAISELKSSSKGKLTFIVLDQIGDVPALQIPEGFTSIESLIRSKNEIRPLLRLLLTNMVLAESLTAAQEAAKSQPGFTYCTPEGERFAANGVIRGGSFLATEGIRIGKREEMERLVSEKLRLEGELTELKSQIEDRSRRLESTTLILFEQKVRVANQSLNEIEKKLSQIHFEQKSYKDEITLIQTSEAADRAESEKLAIRLAEIEPVLRGKEKEEAEETEKLNIALESLTAEEREIELASEKVQRQNIQVKEAEYEVERIRTALNQNAQDEKNSERQIERAKSDIQNANEEAFRLSSELETMTKNLDLLTTERSTLRLRFDELEKGYSQMKGELTQAESKLREVSRSREVLTQITLTLQKELMQINLQEENLKQTIKNEYELELELKEFPEEESETAQASKTEKAERVQTLKNKLRSLGGVNELALEEYEKEKERFEFLSTQQNDLLTAEKDLRQTIDEINKTAVDQFDKTFTQIRSNFVGIFRELFNEGDEADLVLQESDDPLEASIEIIAKPKGKRPQAITLLSGGEKTLTATALLFAIYLVKPSPFCILDEVDAPLDDANIDRFVKLIKKFAKETQFIMVTHNKRTMEAAGVLYGVTMEEEGVSKLVAARFNDFHQN
ncbi:MAG: chromosome segregation protein SMC [Chloroherpetonaceae bacterium]|nr:chromosome segregation protein SMC [Chloroherpetonaceae bacterium]